MAPIDGGPADGAAAPAVAFGEGRRPESRTQVQLPEFDGPLALLLSLIEARQLDVLTVPLGALADAYLDALGRLEADRLGNVSSFVAVASQLILIKSRAMLPRRTDPTDPLALADEGLDPEAELRARLLLYRAYREPACAWPRTPLRRSGCSAASPPARAPPALAGPRRSMRRRSTRAVSPARSTGWRHRRPRSRRPRSWAARSRSPNAPRSSARPCATPRGSCSRTSSGACATGSWSRSRSWPAAARSCAVVRRATIGPHGSV